MLGCGPKSKGCLHPGVKCGIQDQLAPSLTVPLTSLCRNVEQIQEFLLATCGAGCVAPQTGRQQDGQLAEMPDPDRLCLVSLFH